MPGLLTIRRICGIILKHEKNGVWLSLVERLVRDQEAAGSNPVTPTKKKTVKNRCNAYIYGCCGGFFYVLFLSVFVRFYAFETVKKTVKILTKLSRSHRRLRTAPSAGDTVTLGGKLI